VEGLGASISGPSRNVSPKAMGFVNTWGAFGVMVLPAIIGRLVDITGSFVSGFYVLKGAALLGCLCSLALKAPKGVC
jgi:nitrate/nitrite transporter NarK